MKLKSCQLCIDEFSEELQSKEKFLWNWNVVSFELTSFRQIYRKRKKSRKIGSFSALNWRVLKIEEHGNDGNNLVKLKSFQLWIDKLSEELQNKEKIWQKNIVYFYCERERKRRSVGFWVHFFCQLTFQSKRFVTFTFGSQLALTKSLNRNCQAVSMESVLTSGSKPDCKRNLKSTEIPKVSKKEKSGFIGFIPLSKPRYRQLYPPFET